MIEKFWTGNSLGYRVGRVALAPLEGLYRSAVAIRGQLFKRGVIAIQPSPIAVVSVGNLTVGGTGKTPMSAWIASRLVTLGRKPAIVLRGYGDDEPLVHSRLNPGVEVIVEKRRSAGIARAAATGADVAVLDDAFQHRAAARHLDIVLMSADSWTGRQHLLPAGPYRESPEGIRRASLIVITRKAAVDAAVAEVKTWVERTAPDKPIAVARLGLLQLVRASPPEEVLPVRAIEGKRILALAAIGNASAFFRQLESHGATVVPLRFADHHAFSSKDVRRAIALARGMDFVVCTLKDAVKLAPIWPAGEAPLWYVSLSVEVESGGAVLDEMLKRLPARANR